MCDGSYTDYEQEEKKPQVHTGTTPKNNDNNEAPGWVDAGLAFTQEVVEDHPWWSSLGAFIVGGVIGWAASKIFD